MAVASLPKLPAGREFEEMIAAAFQGAGHYVERDIVEREEIEILQLDAICTDYTERPPLLQLIEAKSGDDWGFKDIFKIKGWTTYLNITRAALVAAKPKDRMAAYQRLAEKVGVKLLLVETPAKLSEGLAPLLGEIVPDDRDIWTWRFAYWVERTLLERVRQLSRTQPGQQRFKAILDHAFQVNSGVFFASTVADRVEALYETYRRYRNLAGRCGLEITGGAFETEDARIPEEVFRRAFHRHELDEIHAACWLEHRARLSLLKAAVDYLSYKADGAESKAEGTITWTLDGREFKMSTASFPSRFEEALAGIAREPAYRRYPAFWQWFLGVFGGFILKDYENQELALLSAKTGVPPEEIPNAFSVFDKLFPIDGGWFREIGSATIRYLMLYPSPMRGVGANYRRVVHSAEGKFESLALTGLHTRDDLLQWNNSTVALLT